MSEVIRVAGQAMGQREYLRAARRLADRSAAAREWRGNSRRAVVVVLTMAAVALAWGIVAAIY